jgi:hypothetical protein
MEAFYAEFGTTVVTMEFFVAPTSPQEVLDMFSSVALQPLPELLRLTG